MIPLILEINFVNKFRYNLKKLDRISGISIFRCGVLSVFSVGYWEVVSVAINQKYPNIENRSDPTQLPNFDN